jgi:hypothetical protein
VPVLSTLLETSCRSSSQMPNITNPPFLSWLHQPPHQFYSLYLRNHITLTHIGSPSSRRRNAETCYRLAGSKPLRMTTEAAAFASQKSYFFCSRSERANRGYSGLIFDNVKLLVDNAVNFITLLGNSLSEIIENYTSGHAHRGEISHF